MNWSRGLFRLWLVMSVVWIGAVLLVTNPFRTAADYLGGEFLRADVAASELSVSPPKEGIILVRFKDRAYEVDPSGVQPSDDNWMDDVLAEIALEINKDAAQVNARLRKDKADTIAKIGLAALPPLSMLALGASMVWAIYGFAGRRR